MYNYRQNLYLGTQLQQQGHSEAAFKFINKLVTIQADAHTMPHAAQEAQKCFFDHKKGLLVEFYIGDWVWLKAKTQDRQPLVKTTQLMAKLDSKWFSPFQITASIGQVAYHINIPKSWKQKGKHNVFYKAYLSLHHSSVFKSSIVKPEVIDREEIFEVKCILDSKKVGHSIHYLIKWCCYDHTDNTWKPTTNINT